MNKLNPKYDPSWTSESISIFEDILLAHGGWSAWNKINSFSFTLKQFKGGLVWVKGLNRTFFKPEKTTVFPKEQRVEFKYCDRTDIYENGQVTVKDQHYSNGKNLFTKTSLEQWTPAHLTFFFGYSWLNYISYPFSLPNYELIDLQLTKLETKLTIRFPRSRHTHSEFQTFYFNRAKLLYRHDYRARIAGPLVYGAHYTEGYEKHLNIYLPTVRKVYPRVLSWPVPIYGIYGELEFIR